MSRLSRWLRGLRLLIGQVGTLGANAERPVERGIAEMRETLSSSPRASSLSTASGIALVEHRETRYVMQASLDDVIERRLSYSGIWEPDLLDVLRRLLVPDSIFVDVGANVGAITLAIAEQNRRQNLRIVCLEPNARLASRLRANLQINQLERVRVIEKAASSENGEITLFQVPEGADNQGLSTTYRVARSQDRDSVAVEAVTLDTLLSEPGLTEGPLVLKIDVEGAEYDVLDGARETLRSRRPAIVFEFVAKLHDDPESAAQDQARLFEEAGYRLYSISDRVRSFLPETSLDGDFAGDVLALPVELGSQGP